MQNAASFDFSTLPYLLAYGTVFLLAGVAWSAGLFGIKRPYWRGAAWMALLLGALGFVVTMKVQPPLQLAFGRWGQEQQLSVYVYGFGATLISGIVQELLKLLAMLIPYKLSAGKQSWLALGLAAGVGFGVWEAWQIVAWPLSTAGMVSTVAVIERVFAIAYHIATPMIMAYGLHKRKLWPFLTLAILSHGVANYAAVLYHQWVISLVTTEILISVFASGMLGYAYMLSRRVLREEA